MTNENGIGWCLIPPEVMARKDLSANEKLIIGRVNGLRNEEGFCFASNEWLGKQIGLSEGTVSNIISLLVKKKLLRREIIRNERNEVIQRRLYPLSIIAWIGIHGRMDYSNRNVVIENNDNAFVGKQKPVSNNKTTHQKITGSIEEYIADELNAKNDIDMYSIRNKPELVFAVGYYLTRYEEKVGKPHPKITPEQWDWTVKEGFLFEEGECLDEKQWQVMIDDWFENKNIVSDYNIIHFASGDIIKNRFYSKCY